MQVLSTPSNQLPFANSKFLLVIMSSIAYFIAAKLGSLVSIADGNISPLWPASGLMIALVLTYGYWISSAAFIGTLIFVISNNTHLSGAMGAALGNTLEPFLATYLARKFIDIPKLFSSWENITKFFIFAALIATALCALIGVASIVIAMSLPWEHFPQLFINWWLGDLIGAVIFAPIILIMTNSKYTQEVRGNELLWPLFGLSILTISIFLYSPSTSSWRLEYLLFPVVIWISLRQKLFGAALAVLIVTVITTTCAAIGFGPFEFTNSPSNVPALQLYLVALAFSCFVIAATEYQKALALSGVGNIK